MTKEQESEEFKKRFGDNPSFDGQSKDTFDLLKFCSCPAVINMARWNKWREDNPDIEINLPGAALQKAHLVDADLRGVHLEGANLTGAHLEGADFTGAWLNGAYFEGATFSKETIFNYAKLRNTTWSRAVHLEGIEFKFAEFQGTNLHLAHFEGANLGGAHFEETILSCVHFESIHDKNLNTFLQGCYFNGAKLMSAIFDNNYLYDVHFRQTNSGKVTALDSASFVNTTIDNTTFNNAYIGKADFTDATIISVNLEVADLRYAILEGTSIRGNNPKTNLSGTNFTGASVNGRTQIQVCDIDEKTDFTSVDLDSIRIDPPLLSDLKTNIKKIAWSRYYKEIGRTFTGKIKICIIKLFWWFSDYGSSVYRILWGIPITALGFTLIYILIATSEPDTFTNIDLFNRMPQFRVPLWRQFISVSYFAITSTVPLWLFVIFNFFCFSLVTMVTLGFGGINVATVYDNLSISALALCLVTFNIIAGYIYLSLLVIQFGNFLQSLPSRRNRTKYQEKSKTSKEPEENDNK